MLKKVCVGKGMVTGGWVSLDPADMGLIESVYKKNLREGEQKLMLAVLQDAVEYFQKYFLARNPHGKQLFQEAEDWFFDKDSEALFSFESICDALGLNPNHIRKGLLVWKDPQLKFSSAAAHRAGRRKITRSRVKRPSIRLSKTA
jgi:hypothetical protein